MRPWGNKKREAEPAAQVATVTGVRLDDPEAPRQWIAPGEPIISLRGVTKSFGPHTVLEDVTFDVPKGRTTAILGPSGTGKSVLLKNILGLLQPDRGEIWVDGEQIVGMRERKLYEVRKKFGVLFQDGALFGSMSLYDNIAFPLREHTRKSEREIREVVLRNAELVGLLAHLKKLPGEVSGGMKKRAGLARAMVTEPDIVLFDEPDSGLDPVRVAYLDDLVNTAQRETGATFFVITHNIASVRRIADYMGVLFRSKLVRFASKEEMLATDDPVIAQFLAGRPDGPIGMDEMADSTEPAGRRSANGKSVRPAPSPPMAAGPVSTPGAGGPERAAPAGNVGHARHTRNAGAEENAGAAGTSGAAGGAAPAPEPMIAYVPAPADADERADADEGPDGDGADDDGARNGIVAGNGNRANGRRRG